MNALTVIRFTPRRDIKRVGALKPQLVCRWVKDPRSRRLVCRWLALYSVHDEKPGPDLRIAA
jgi:hypothetical protein